MDIQRDTLAYTACYCEENVYQLLASLPESQRRFAFAVFISNPEKMVRSTPRSARRL